jgi:hypothetical protein
MKVARKMTPLQPYVYIYNEAEIKACEMAKLARVHGQAWKLAQGDGQFAAPHEKPYHDLPTFDEESAEYEGIKAAWKSIENRTGAPDAYNGSIQYHVGNFDGSFRVTPPPPETHISDGGIWGA